MSQTDSIVSDAALHTIHIPNELFVNIEKFDATVDDTHLNITMDTGHNWKCPTNNYIQDTIRVC